MLCAILKRRRRRVWWERNLNNKMLSQINARLLCLLIFVVSIMVVVGEDIL
jgi:hypothetical protein